MRSITPRLRKHYFTPMRLQQLQALILVVDTGSLSEAARLLGLTQSALSKSIKSLELELGVPLFERTSAGLTATAYNQPVLGYARATIEGLHRVRTNLSYCVARTRPSVSGSTHACPSI